jgi:hypothetical protein
LQRRVNPWVFAFGGWWLSLLWSGSRKKEVQCVQCDTVFLRPTRASKIALVVFVLVVVLILLGILKELAGPPSGVPE